MKRKFYKKVQVKPIKTLTNRGVTLDWRNVPSVLRQTPEGRKMWIDFLCQTP